MKVLLIDTCVITDLTTPGSDWFEWSSNALEALDQQHRLVINPVIYAECSVAFQRIEDVDALFSHLGFALEPIPKPALFLAGKAFLRYRQQQGQKTSVLPDFFIGAHAAVAGYKLISRDKGRYSSYFPGVELICPGVN